MRVPEEIAIEADFLSKETRIDFRDILDVLMRAYLRGETRLELEVLRSFSLGERTLRGERPSQTVGA